MHLVNSFGSVRADSAHRAAAAAFILVLLAFAFLSAGCAPEPEAFEVPGVPPGSMVVKAGTWERTGGGYGTVLFAKSEDSGEYVLRFEAEERLRLELASVEEIRFGRSEGEMLGLGTDSENRRVLFGSGGILRRMECGDRAVVSENGRDYAYLDASGLYKNGRPVSFERPLHMVIGPGGRLAYVLPGGAVCSDDEGPVVPAGILDAFDSVRLWFDSADRLMVSYGSLYRPMRDGGFAVVRREGMFPANEKEILRNGDYGEFLKRHSLFLIVHEESGSPEGGSEMISRVYRNGETDFSADFITEYSVNRDGSSILTVSYDRVERRFAPFHRTRYLTDQGVGFSYPYEYSIRQDGKTLAREPLVRIIPMSAILDPSNIGLAEFSLSNLQDDSGGVPTDISFAGAGTPLAVMDLPENESREYTDRKLRHVASRYYVVETETDVYLGESSTRTRMQIGRRVQDGLARFEFFDNQHFLPADCAIAVGRDGGRSLVLNGRRGDEAYARIVSASPRGEDGLDVYVFDQGRLERLSFAVDERRPGSPPEPVLPEYPDLEIHVHESDEDGDYLGTDRGLFFSFDRGRHWTHFPGDGSEERIDPGRISLFRMNGDVGILKSGGLAWMSLDGGKNWERGVAPEAMTDVRILGDTLLVYGEYGKTSEYRLSGDLRMLPISSMRVEPLILDGPPTRPASFALRDRADGITYLLDRGHTTLYSETEGGWSPYEFGPPGDPRSSMITDIHFESSRRILGTVNGLYISEDGGKRWMRRSAADGMSGNVVSRLIVRGDLLAVRTGSTLVELNARGAARFKFINTYNNGLFSWHDGSWIFDHRSAADNDPNLEFRIGEELPDTVWEPEYMRYREEGCYDGVSVSADGGSTWRAMRFEDITASDAESCYWGSSLCLVNGILYACTGKELFASEDSGVSWSPIPLPEGEGRASISEEGGRPALFLRDVEEDTGSVFFYENGRWDRFEPDFGPMYLGEDCRKIRTDAESVKAYPKDHPPMAYAKDTGEWRLLEDG